jgi:uncharacterized protein YcnI
MRNWLYASFVASIGLIIANTAHAHISIASGPAVANQSQEIAFGVGHGCAGADTYSVKVHIPPAITSLRPMDSLFGRAAIERDMTGAITGVTWTKDPADVLPADEQFYKMTIRMRIPDAPFTMMYFHVTQVCRDAMGTETVVEWEALPGQKGEPAAELVILPARSLGWNKFMVVPHVHDVAPFFKDAQIVWAGTAAFSANANTTELIAREPGTTVLSEIEENTEIWVKY